MEGTEETNGIRPFYSDSSSDEDLALLAVFLEEEQQKPKK
jgi:hypothetical protein